MGDISESEHLEKKNQVWAKLRSIIDPEIGKDIVDLGYISHLKVKNGHVYFHMHLPVTEPKLKEQYQFFSEKAVRELSWVTSVTIVQAKAIASSPLKPAFHGLEDVTHIVAVASCKGGVGKSTIAVNLAFSLALTGRKVGLFDADVYGPSLPTMVGMENPSIDYEGVLLKPLEKSGVKMMSFGFAQDKTSDDAAILRGPIVSQVINQLLSGTAWGECDILVLDLPPGTGDIHLTLTQMFPIDASVMVTTPQRLAVVDVVKGLDMFKKVNVPTIAAIENMSYFDSADGQRHHIFGEGHLDQLRTSYDIPYTAALPIQADVAGDGDAGTPHVMANPNSETSSVFNDLAQYVITALTDLDSKRVPTPSIRFVPDEGIYVAIPSHDIEDMLSPADLRRKCRCAHCVDEFSGEVRLDAASVDEDVEPLVLRGIGNYALGIDWSDGHASVYPYTFIHHMLNTG